MESIKIEAKRNSKVATNVDKLRSRVVESYDGTMVMAPSFDIYSYEFHLYKLLASSKRIDFDLKWAHRPDYVSIEYYGSPMFWQLLLFVNSIDCIENFTNLTYVLIPSYDAIVDIARMKSEVDFVLDIGEEEATNVNDIRYYQNYPLDQDELNRREAQDRFDENIEWSPGDVNKWNPNYNANPYTDKINDSWDGGKYPDIVETEIDMSDYDPDNLYVNNSTHITHITPISPIDSSVNIITRRNSIYYTVFGCTGNLGLTEDDFLTTESIQIYVNDVLQAKGTDVIWVSDVCFKLTNPIDVGDTLVVHNDLSKVSKYANKESLITLTEASLLTRTFDITTSDTFYNFGGDVIDNIGMTNDIFLTDDVLKFYLNAELLTKGTDIIWLSPTTFDLVRETNIDDELIIHSYTDPSGYVATKTTTLTMIQDTTIGTLYNLNISGTIFNIQGDLSVDLLASEIEFDSTTALGIYLNGVLLNKGTEVVWTSNKSFTLNVSTSSDDVIIIIS